MRRFGKFLLILVITLFFLFSILVVAGAIILHRYSQSHVDEALLDVSKGGGETEFYRYEVSELGEYIGNPILIEDASINSCAKFNYVSYAEIPKELIDAFVAIEDRRFWDHNGIDFLRSGKAVLNYVFGGKSSFGGSTITQQLVKNLTGNDQRLIERKLIEAFSAMNLEREYDKSEIIEMYLNIINLANGCRGIGAAAQYYFSKDVSELSLRESVAIAAITNNPSKYDPIRHPEENQKRSETVLFCMHKLGYISEEQYRATLCEDLVLSVKSKDISHVNSWYIDTVIEDVISDMAKKYGISRKNASVLLYKGGYKIYTLMDGNIQAILDDYFSNIDNFPENIDGSIPEASMVIIDPHSGNILGIIGGIGEKKGNRIFNYATNSKRPSGSAIKPLSVYALAIERGLVNWSSIVSDTPVNQSAHSGNPWPMNANRKYNGDVTVEYALSHSLNTVAVKLLGEVGLQSSFDFLTRTLEIFSLDAKEDSGYASLALGQHSVGISLRELVSAYTVFDEGIKFKSRTYCKVTDMNGKIILDNTRDCHPAISRETAAIMTKLMQRVVDEGTASGLITLTDRVEVAGKTGTTQNNCDKYFVGYTPSLLAGVWQGYDMPRSLEYAEVNYSAVIWDDVMNMIYETTDSYENNKAFTIPHNVKKLNYDSSTGLAPNVFDSPAVQQEGWFEVSDPE